MAVPPVSSLGNGVAAVIGLLEPHGNLECPQAENIVIRKHKCHLQNPKSQRERRRANRSLSHSAQGISLSLQKKEAKADSPICL